MTPEQAALVERLRTLLASEQVVRETSMFGVRSFMVNEKMAVSALKGGGLLVRVDAGRNDELLSRPGAAQAEMGTARTMGPGWIEIAADAINDDRQLAAWVDIAMEYNRMLTGSGG